MTSPRNNKSLANLRGWMTSPRSAKNPTDHRNYEDEFRYRGTLKTLLSVITVMTKNMTQQRWSRAAQERKETAFVLYHSRSVLQFKVLHPVGAWVTAPIRWICNEGRLEHEDFMAEASASPLFLCPSPVFSLITPVGSRPGGGRPGGWTIVAEW